MADNVPEPQGAAPAPDDSSASRKQTASGRVVVTLSSVAKTPPPLATSGVAAPPKELPAAGPRSAILPAKEVAEKQLTVPSLRPQLNRTMEVKLPPKSGVQPKLTTLSSMPLAPAAAAQTNVPAIEPAPPVGHKTAPPPLATPQPAKKRGLRFPAFKLKPFRLGSANAEESIFPAGTPKETPKGWKHLEPGEVPLSAEAAAAKREAFERAAAVKQTEPANSVLLPPEVPPAPLIVPGQTDGPAPPASVHIAPPLADHSAGEGLLLPPPLYKAEPAPPPLIKAPALAEPARHLAAPLPSGSAVPHSPPARPAVTPPPLPRLISAWKKTGSISVTTPPARKEPPVPAPILDVVPPKTEKPPAPLAQPELPMAGARIPSPPPPEISATTESVPPPPVEPVPVVPPLFAPRAKEPALPVEKSNATGQVTEPPPPVSAKHRPPASPVVPVDTEIKPPSSRSERIRKRRLIGTIVFYLIFLGVVVPLLFILSLHFSSETRIEGQVIPPPGTLLCNEVWIVSDFRELASGIADDLAAERAPKLQEIQERQDHVQRAQADIASREERIRLLQEQIQAAKDEIASSIKEAHDASQKVWDGPGAELEDEYKTKLDQFQAAIAARAKSLNLNYAPDNTYQSPEVWANAYRLALYQTPAGVDGTKEHQWIEDQLKLWRDFTKSFDDRKEKLRLQAAQIQLSPAAQITDLNGKIDDLQHRVDSTQAEEDPLKTELAQAQSDLAEAQAAEATLDGKYYQQLYALPESSITKRLPLRPNGRFSWQHLEKDSAFAEGEKAHAYWIFARAVRKDSRQYWVLAHFSIGQNSILPILIEPASFISTKAILRPDLSPDEQQQ
jgi:peptidoglycan hydrolase CwlO-like protein